MESATCNCLYLLYDLIPLRHHISYNRDYLDQIYVDVEDIILDGYGDSCVIKEMILDLYNRAKVVLLIGFMKMYKGDQSISEINKLLYSGSIFEHECLNVQNIINFIHALKMIKRDSPSSPLSLSSPLLPPLARSSVSSSIGRQSDVNNGDQSDRFLTISDSNDNNDVEEVYRQNDDDDDDNDNSIATVPKLIISNHIMIDGQLYFGCIKDSSNPLSSGLSLSDMEIDLKAEEILARDESVLYNYVKRIAPILRKDILINLVFNLL